MSAQQLSSSSQFKTTPRFSFGRSKAPVQPQRSPSPPKPALVQVLRATARPLDDVEDAPVQQDDHEMLDDDQTHVLPTTEDDAAEPAIYSAWSKDLALSPKRRRLDFGDTFQPPGGPAFKQPQTPASQRPRQTPHFTRFEDQSSQVSTSTESATTRRPVFLRASVAPQEPSGPVPEVFSPHRRGQKFVPGGMAATAQQWVIETGQTAVQSRKGQGYLRGDDYVMRVKIDELNGDGPFTVRASLSSGDAVNMLLAGGANVSNDGMNARVGGIVGIRAPTWDLELDGRRWTVGVDWKLIS